MEVLEVEAVELEVLPVVVLENPEALENQYFAQVQVVCFAQVQVEPRRQKANQAVDPISLVEVLDSEGVEMRALMRFDFQLGHRKIQVQFAV